MANYVLDPIGIRPGDIVAGKYRVERVLGAGGMGVVLAAHHVDLAEKVAIKLLHPDMAGNDEAQARFVREARAAVRIKNEHVARVTDVGQLENGSPYMVMEYLEGRDLAAWVAQNGALGVEQAVDFVLQACEAVADAHALGIVHRDLKPANLFWIERSDGRASIKVLDFGISKITTPGAIGHGMTRTGALMGSPFYMSPEQMLQSKSVDARTDIWALGVILFELVVGHPPFQAEAVTELAIKVANEPAPSVRALRPEVPRGLDKVVATCLEKDRARRFQDVGELAVALKDFGPKHAQWSVDRVLGTVRNSARSSDAPKPSDPPRPSVVPLSVEPSKSQTAASWGQTFSGSPMRAKALAFAGVAAVIGTVALVGWLALRRPVDASAPRGVELETRPPAAVAPPNANGDPAPSAAGADLRDRPTPGEPSVAPESRLAPLVTAPPAKPPTRSGRPGRPPSATASASAPHDTPAAPAAPPTTKPNCNPPYVIDSAGDRQYKPECL